MAPPPAYVFMGLNVVRALSIISLILVFASSILVMVTNIKAVNNFQAAISSGSSNSIDAEEYLHDCDYIEGSTVPNQAAGVFWAVVASLFILFQSVVLMLSEIGWPMSFFDRFFPVLGSQFGLGALGIFQCLIGAQILSHHVDDFTLVAGFFLFSIGCLNMFLGLVFRQSAKDKRSITSWRAETKGVLPKAVDDRPIFVNASPAYVSRMFTGSSGKTTSTFSEAEKASIGFGRQGEKAAGLRGFILQKPEESLPRYASPSPPPRKPSVKSVRTSTSSFASPFSYRDSAPVRDTPNQKNRDDDDDDDDHTNYNNNNYNELEHGQSPSPTFKSSPTAI